MHLRYKVLCEKRSRELVSNSLGETWKVRVLVGRDRDSVGHKIQGAPVFLRDWGTGLYARGNSVECRSLCETGKGLLAGSKPETASMLVLNVEKLS